MKKVIHLLVILFLSLTFILTGCEKDKNPEGVSEITVNAVPLNPEYGGFSKLSWSFPDKYDRVTVTVGDSIISTKKSDYGVMLENLETNTIVSFSGFLANTAVPDVKIVEINPKLPQAPIVTLKANPASIPRGFSTTINWTITGVVDSVKSDLPGLVGIDGNITISPTENTTYFLTAYGKGGITTESLTISVTEPTPLQLLQMGKWKTVELYSTCEPIGRFREPIPLGAECEEDDFWHFRTDNVLEYNMGNTLCPGETHYAWYWLYTYVGDSVYISGNPRKIILLTEGEMAWTFNSSLQWTDGQMYVTLIEQRFVRIEEK
ncbi:hypothetical protein SDC9_19246 [bioreactor metagenome]|jgi:hypothetical protein|uniref:Uncharacterized protein n=1 Tax=bioreactor metagenome TaxID=1076179 RepID=A0A644U2G8_9ZZZZ|nr:hypothetical protein [Lentimicrobium sp.]MEA5109763.1 hypothetical protein [Lentimicrobium sp.]